MGCPPGSDSRAARAQAAHLAGHRILQRLYRCANQRELHLFDIQRTDCGQRFSAEWQWMKKMPQRSLRGPTVAATFVVLPVCAPTLDVVRWYWA